jgi:hypothetical protein
MSRQKTLRQLFYKSEVEVEVVVAVWVAQVVLAAAAAETDYVGGLKNFSPSTIDGNNISKIFFSKLVQLS